MVLIWPDYIIISIIVISMVISLMRGFVREALSLAGWFLAIWVSFYYMDPMVALLSPRLDLPPSILSLVAFAVLFIITLIMAALVTNLIAAIVDQTGLSGTDRSIGMLFGIVRGIIIVGILVLLAGFTMVPQDPWWKESVLIVHFQHLALAMKEFLPTDIAAKIHY